MKFTVKNRFTNETIVGAEAENLKILDEVATSLNKLTDR